jgi:hypothetical protein
MYDDIQVWDARECAAYETRTNHAITWNFLGIPYDPGIIPLWDFGTEMRIECASEYNVHLVRLLAQATQRLVEV